MLGTAIDRITRNQNRNNLKEHNTRLVGLDRPKLSKELSKVSRCQTSDEIENFSRLRSDDLVFFIVLFQNFEKNLHEFDHLLHDIRRIGQSLNQIDLLSPNRQQLYLQKRRLDKMIKTLRKNEEKRRSSRKNKFSFLEKIFRQTTDQNDLINEFNEYLEFVRDKSPYHQDEIQTIVETIEEKLDEIQNELKKDENQRDVLLIDRFKEKYFPQRK